MNARTDTSILATPTLKADYSRDALMTDFGRATLDDRYLIAGETSPQDGFLRAAVAWADDEAHAARLYDYASKLWFMFSTPVLSNAPVRKHFGTSLETNFLAECFEGKFRGMPISCFLNMPGDSRDGLTAHYKENAWLSSVGGGIGGYWGGIRSNGAKTSSGSSSSGVIPFLKVVDALVLAFSQGETRRGSYAAYIDIGHPEIVEFLEMRKPTGGDANRKCLNLHNAVNIPDAFMQIIERCMADASAGDAWPLTDPNSGRIVEFVSAKELWQRLLDLRMQTGEPYIHFIDATNRALPAAQKALGLRVNQSNLCSEITLATSEERTAVCCLSSVNGEKYDEWKDHPLFIEDLIRMLDNVLEFFCLHAPEAVSRAKFSAMRERSLGLGLMGFHSYLQQHMLPFESVMATSANRRMFSTLKRKADAATRVLALERGECPDGVGTGVRNMHLLAVAPNASSSIICGGTSPSIEPQRANAFTHKTSSGSWLVKNRYLAECLEQYGMDNDEVWQSIVVNKGSVLHLDFLSQDEKDVFKTAMELDQRWIVEHASHRQGYICQAQSLNLFFPADVGIPYLHLVHFQAWKQELKTLYYLRSESIKRADNLSVRVTREDVVAMASAAGESVCLSCEG
jgi:ribonucleoside-diphosphate reductase alpha chain